MALQQTSGNATVDAYGGGVAAIPKYIENFFSTWLRTGTGASATITTGLDASTNKALVWTKSRSAATDHKLTDTVRGVTKAIISNTTGAQTTDTQGLTAFSSTGYTIGTNTDYNNSGATYVDWEFAATPKFFDVVTYTGNGSDPRNITHNLGSTPGCIIIKRTDTASTLGWAVYHRSSGNLCLNSASAENVIFFGDVVNPTSTTFTVSSYSDVNANGGTYVAYLFAHNAGGFGLTGTDNVISCGSFTTDGAGAATVSLGYEPQWVMTKNSSGTSSWRMFDTMRGLTVAGQNDALLQAQSSAAEITNSDYCSPTATGFTIDGHNGSATHIYIAIRRGPMKVPTLGTSVFLPNDGTGSTSGQTISTTFPVDLAMSAYKTQGYVGLSNDRLRGISNTNSAGATPALQTSTTDAESAFSGANPWFIKAWNNSITRGSNGADPVGGIVSWLFGRAPGFFDEVCYTGTSVSQTINHNLNVAPELMIIKSRNTATTDWDVLSNFTVSNFKDTLLNMANSGTNQTYGPGGSPNFEMMTAQPSSSAFFVSASAQLNYSARTFVAYLFATCAGVSKVGSYTGNGTTQTINCGFTGGARFVLIKRTDATGDWRVVDTARGMVSGTDPYLSLNSTAAEVNANNVYTVTTGFQLVSSDANFNANGGSYIFLAVA